ncbi:MAG: response regulator, partial [Planctomycetes bacterium]|nr:response regulator [Planctomycetota bacterium]
MGQRIRILLLSDSDKTADRLTRKLILNGFRVESTRVDSGEALWKMLREKPWDLIIAEDTLSRLSLKEALDLLQEHDKEIPLIVLSTVEGEEAAVTAMKCGAADYIMKDRLNRLVPAIERSIREAQVRRARKRADEVLGKTLSELAESRSEIEEFAYI